MLNFFCHTFRHMLRHSWVADFLLSWSFYTCLWSLPNFSFERYNACLFGLPSFALLACLGNALVQPFRIYYLLLFLIKIPWGRASLLIFIIHSIPFVCDYNWVLFMIFVCPFCDLSLSIPCAMTSQFLVGLHDWYNMPLVSDLWVLIPNFHVTSSLFLNMMFVSI